MTAHAPVVLDIAGTRLNADDRRRLAHPRTAGLILFTRNWESRAQMVELVAEAKSICPELLVAIDHEGGRVQRLRDGGFTPLPPMRRFGELWMRDALAATDAATACGYVLAAELRACGVDLSFAPVLDLDHGPSAVIGDRAFHRDPRVVTLLAKSLMHGMLEAGMSHCGKHFPGHGHVAADSHLAVPVDRRSLNALLADDALPYRRLASTLDAVMPAHVVYPKVDPRPAGFSRRWIEDVLRGRLGFTGAVFSDDLAMAGARVLDGRPVDFATAALAALAAGCDFVLLCNRSLEAGGRELDELLDALDAAAAAGRWTPAAASPARRLALLPTAPPTDWDALMLEPRYRAALERLP